MAGVSESERQQLARECAAKLERGIEQVRQLLLDYDASADRHGEKWDAIRVPLDLYLQQARDAAALLGALLPVPVTLQIAQLGVGGLPDPATVGKAVKEALEEEFPSSPLR